MENVGAIILAAGSSTRLGQPKQFLEWNGQSLLRRAVAAATAAGCAPIIVVAGAAHARLAHELRGTSAEVVVNPEWERGLGTSIRCGVRRVLDSPALVLLVCDQPFVDVSAIAALIAPWKANRPAMVASRYADTVGVPALFDRSCFADLLALPDDAGAKVLLRARPAEVIEVPFEAGAFDIDTPADLERARRIS